MTERRVQVRVRVSGTVQGVSYRAFTRREAEKLGVVGWVRNLDDGRVEGVFQGPQRAVDALVAWCRRGPLCATVSEVAVEPMTLEAFHGFDIRP